MEKAAVLSSEPLYAGLEKTLSQEPEWLRAAKKNGQKVVGYFCPHVPEELIIAGGMIPIRLASGGEIEPATSGEECLKPYSCPYARSCLGYREMGNNPSVQYILGSAISTYNFTINSCVKYFKRLRPIFRKRVFSILDN